MRKIKGGYNSDKWGQTQKNLGDFVHSSRSFIFSLSNPENKPTKFVCHRPEYSVGDCSNWGPTFGGGGQYSDIYLARTPNIDQSCRSDLGNAYSGKFHIFYFLFYLFFNFFFFGF